MSGEHPMRESTARLLALASAMIAAGVWPAVAIGVRGYRGRLLAAAHGLRGRRRPHPPSNCHARGQPRLGRDGPSVRGAGAQRTDGRTRVTALRRCRIPGPAGRDDSAAPRPPAIDRSIGLITPAVNSTTAGRRLAWPG